MLKRLLLKIARSRIASFFIGFTFEHFSRLMPLKRHYEDSRVVVFAHPAPISSLHLVAVPKRRIPSFLHLSLDQPKDRGILLATLQAIQITARQNQPVDHLVLVNGGRYQKVPQIHFHLMNAPSKGMKGNPRSASLFAAPAAVDAQSIQPGSILVYPHPEPGRRFHYVITPAKTVPGLGQLDFSNTGHTDLLLDALRAAQNLAASHALRAYTVVTKLSAGEPEPQLAFHLVSGRRI